METPEKNAEKTEKLTKAIEKLRRSIEKTDPKAKKSDPSSLRDYLKEQTIGKINLMRFLPPQLQAVMGIGKDIRGILRAKKIKKLEQLEAEQKEIKAEESETTTEPKTKKDFKNEKTGEDNVFESLHSELMVQTGLLESLSSITEDLYKIILSSKTNKLDELENERENSRKTDKIIKLNEEGNEEEKESKGLLSSLIGMLKGGRFLMGLTRVLGPLLAPLASIVGPILGIAAAVALGGIIVTELIMISKYLSDIKDINEETKKIVSDQNKLQDRRRKNQQTLQQPEESREDYAFRVQENREKIQERIERVIESDKQFNREEETTLFVTDPRTGETKEVKASEALQIFSEENVSNSLTQEERSEARQRAIERGGVGSSMINVIEGGLFSSGNDEEVREQYFLKTLKPEERSTYLRAKQKEEFNESVGRGGVKKSITAEEQKLLDLSENTDRTAKLAALYEAATTLYNNNYTIREQLVSMGVPLGEFDPSNPQHYKAMLSVATMTGGDAIKVETEGGYFYRAEFTPNIGGPTSVSENISSSSTTRNIDSITQETGPSVTNNTRQGDQVTNNQVTTVHTYSEKPAPAYLRGVPDFGY